MFILSSCVVGGNEVVIPDLLANMVHILYEIIRIGVPILLIFFGMLDLGKAVIAQKDDEIKKGQQTFVHRLIAAVLVFLVFYIVQLVVTVVAPDGSEDGNLWSCVDVLINGEN